MVVLGGEGCYTIRQRRDFIIQEILDERLHNKENNNNKRNISNNIIIMGRYLQHYLPVKRKFYNVKLKGIGIHWDRTR